MKWREMPPLAALRAFEAAARRGSLTAAAAELNVSHAAVSQQVRGLEALLDVQLFVKEGRGLILTPEGRDLSRAVSDGFGQIAAGLHDLRAGSEDAPLALTVTPTFAENWLMPRMGMFWSAHPGRNVSIMPSMDVVDLRRDGFDMGIRYGRGGWAGLDEEFLVPADFVVVAAHSILTPELECSLEELQSLPWVLDAVHREPRRWAMEAGFDLDAVTLRELPTTNMVMQAVRTGGGVSILSRTMIAEDLRHNRLCVLAEFPHDDLGYYMITPKGQVSEKARVFARWLRAQAKEAMDG